MMTLSSKLIDQIGLPTTGTVAVVGPSGGGKSTLAGEMAEHLGAALLGTDEFLIPEAERTGTGLVAKYDLRALDLVLARLQAGRPAEYAPFDQRTRQRGARKTVMPSASGNIVVEGIVALYAERVLATSALAMYVDAPPDVREARQLARLDREGWYQDLPRAAIEARIRAKRDTEDAIVRQQLARCQYMVITDGTASRIIPLMASVAA